MQDEISMGFDRLIAMASEVDKRRKSAENSPVQVATNTLPFDQFKSRKLCCFCVASMDNMFQLIWELFRTGLLHAKVRQTWDFLSPRILWRKNSRWVPKNQPQCIKKTKIWHLMTSQAGLMGGEGGSGRREDRSKENPSFPGDKLPEHHFKKK